MLLLAFDTAGPHCAVALARFDGREVAILHQASERLERGHAERLVPMVEEALAEGGLSYRDLDRIGVTTGPGSFTGVRVGIAAARGFALALGIPAVGIGSLAALLNPIRSAHDAGTAVAVVDSRRGQLSLAACDLASGAAICTAAAATVGEAVAALERAVRPLILTGSGAALLAAALDGSQSIAIVEAEAPDIADVARLAADALPGSPPLPIYARGADAKPQAGKAVRRA